MIMPASGAFSRVLIVDKQAVKSEVVITALKGHWWRPRSGDWKFL